MLSHLPGRTLLLSQQEIYEVVDFTSSCWNRLTVSEAIVDVQTDDILIILDRFLVAIPLRVAALQRWAECKVAVFVFSYDYRQRKVRHCWTPLLREPRILRLRLFMDGRSAESQRRRYGFPIHALEQGLHAPGETRCTLGLLLPYMRRRPRKYRPVCGIPATKGRMHSIRLRLSR